MALWWASKSSFSTPFYLDFCFYTLLNGLNAWHAKKHIKITKSLRFYLGFKYNLEANECVKILSSIYIYVLHIVLHLYLE